MPQPANLFDTYDVVGRREDLAEVIYMISPTRTPLMLLAGRGDASNIFHEWQNDALAAVDLNNAVIDGDDATTDAVTATNRVGNHCQISDKVIIMSGTLEATKRAGRKREMAREIRKKGKELKRDMDSILSQNQASVAGSNVVARRCGSLEAWLTTNDLRNGIGAQGGFGGGIVAAATDGAVRPFTETLLKELLQLMWIAGADGSVFLTGPRTKQKFSTFDGSGKVQRRQDAKTKTVTAAVDVYESDFGTHRVMPSRWSRDRTFFALDPDYIKVCFLRAFQMHKLAKTGDSNRVQMLSEYTLEINESAHGVIAEIDIAA